MDSMLTQLGSSGIVAIVFSLLALWIVKGAIVIVPQGFEYTVERFGRYTRTLRPGLSFLVPFLDRIGHRINMMEQVKDVPSQEIITRDNAMVTVDGVVFFQIVDASRAAYEVTGLESAILNLVMTNIRTVMGSMDLDELLSQRDKINAMLLGGRRDAAFRDAEARERLAEAEANATRMVSVAIADGDIQAINYFVANKYVEALKDIASAPNQKTLFMPLEAGSLIGAIGGIAELARSASEDRQKQD